MKKILTILILIGTGLTATAQYYKLGYDSVLIRSKLKLGTVTTGSTLDSILVKKPNGGVYKIAYNSFGSGTVTSVSSANSDISVATGTTTPVLTFNAAAYVNTTGSQTVAGSKQFSDIFSSGNVNVQGQINANPSTDARAGFAATANSPTSVGSLFWGRTSAGATVFTVSPSGITTGASFVKSGGTSSQFLKADGSVDATTYVPSTRTVAGFALSSNVTLASHTAGYGLSGSAYAGSGSTAWTADTTSATGLVSKTRLTAYAYSKAQTDALLNTVSSGTYTPTPTYTLNVTSATLQLTHYTRVGNQVTVYGGFIGYASASGGQTWRITLPVASNLASDDDLQGHGVLGVDANDNIIIKITGDPTNDQAILSASATASTAGTGRFSFMYTVIP